MKRIFNELQLVALGLFLIFYFGFLPLFFGFILPVKLVMILWP